MHEQTSATLPVDDADTAQEGQQTAWGHIRSFVLRQGHLSAAQKRYHELMMPKIGIAYTPAPLDLTAAFGRVAPKIMEIGCGMGETSARIAQGNPQNDYLGLEVHTPGVGNLCKLIDENQIGNLRLIQHDAVEVVRDMIGESTLDGIHVFFPDPWHKKRHHKRRLLKPEFVAELAKRLKPGGYIHCATDWEDYAQQMLEVLSGEVLLENTADGFALRPDYRPLTKFENRGLKLGHGVWDLIFLKRT
jgi:tRNA (guanine-N7-)-methyltransferase